MKSYDWAKDLTEEQWLQWLAGSLVVLGTTPPKMPLESTQSLFVGMSGITALTEAMRFLNHINRAVRLPSSPEVLDFACGWGRLFRTMLREDWNITGADSEPAMISTCKADLPGEFVQIERSPPYPFAGNKFNLIYVYSLFSHIPESVSRGILQEFARILKPGAYVALTLLEESEAIKVWQHHKSFEPKNWHEDTESGKTLYLPTGGGFESMPNDSYGWSYYSPAAFIRILSDLPFKLLQRSVVEGVPQDVVILQRI